jgi:small subunit ribosomal protein S18
MAKKLFVSNLDFEISNDQLTQLFAEVGSVISVVIATDRETKRSKGFAFVEMEKEEDGQKAIDSLNNMVINGRPIKVCADRGKTGGRDAGEGGYDGQRRSEPLPSIQRMQIFRRKKKLDPFMQDPNKSIDYKDVATLSRFLSERGKILSRRLTGLSAYNQRQVAKAIKRAQNMGLLPFTTV